MKSYFRLFEATGLLAVSLLAANLHAQTATVWNPLNNPSSTDKWSEAANWTGGVVPDAGYKAVFNVSGSPACVVDTAAAKHHQHHRQ